MKDEAKPQNEAILKQVAIFHKANEERDCFRRWGRRGFTEISAKDHVGGCNYTIGHQTPACFLRVNGSREFACVHIEQRRIGRKFQDAGGASPIIDYAALKHTESDGIVFNFNAGIIDFDGEKGSLQFSESAFGYFGTPIVGIPKQGGASEQQSAEKNEQPISKLISRLFWSYYTAAALGIAGGLLIGWRLTR